MNSRLRKGLLVGLVHVAIVASLGAKFVVDRATLPRVWVRTAPVDPNLPIRGRYVSLRLEVAAPDVTLQPPPPPVSSAGGRTWTPRAPSVQVTLEIRNQQLVAVPARSGSVVWLTSIARGDRRVAVLDRPVAYFISEHVVDPSRLNPGEELWVEVTLPRRGSPRPIRLGVKRDGVLVPVDVR